MDNNFNNYGENENENLNVTEETASTPAETEPEADKKASDNTGDEYTPFQNRYSSETRSYSYNPDPVTPVKKKKSHAPAVAVCIIFALLLCVGAFFAGRYFGKDNNEEPKGPIADADSTNVADGGDVTASDQTLAYNNTVVEEDDTVKVVSKTVDSVVEIQTESVVYGSFYGQSVSQGAGSGVIVTPDGFIVTNNHVIDGAEKVTVRLRNGEEYDAVIWGVNTKNDLAVIKIEATGLSAATFGNSDNLKVGQTVIAIGNPLGELGGTVTTGIVSALAREIKVDNKMMTLIQTDAPVNPGNSGGGLFNLVGELIGIVNAKSSGDDVEGIGFAIPSTTAREIVQNIIENKSSTDKAYLGVEIAQTRQGYVYISKVVDGYDAQKSGLKKNDIILSVDGNMISSPNVLSSLISSYCVGDTVEFVIYRDNKSQIINVTFETPRPADVD